MCKIKLLNSSFLQLSFYSWLKKMEFSVVNEVNLQCGNDVMQAFGYKPMNHVDHTILKLKEGNHSYPLPILDNYEMLDKFLKLGIKTVYESVISDPPKFRAFVKPSIIG